MRAELCLLVTFLSCIAANQISEIDNADYAHCIMYATINYSCKLTKARLKYIMNDLE